MEPIQEIANGEERQLDPRSVQAARVVGGIVTLVAVTGGIVGNGITVLVDGPAKLAYIVPGWLVFTGFVAFTGLVWPAKAYKHTSYRIDETGIRIRRGVLWRSEVTVPRSRVQHTDVSRGPVERSFDLATLIIHTAGTQHASVALGGLAAEQAYPIRDYLLAVGDGDAV